MAESNKKSLMIVLVVVCIALAGFITLITLPKKSGGIESIDPNKMVWVKCSNPDCGTEYQMGKRAYHQYIEDNFDANSLPKMMMPPTDTNVADPNTLLKYQLALVCKKCGQESAYRAVKCEKCSSVFYYGTVRHDYADRCPGCKYSHTEESRKKAARR